MFCKHCGEEICDEAYVCLNCGCKVDGKDDQTPTSKAFKVSMYSLTAFFPVVGLFAFVCFLVKGEFNHAALALVEALFVWVLWASVIAL